MSVHVRLPEKIEGEWIWKKSHFTHPDNFLLFRKEFVSASIGMETNLWISANCNYQLFINGKFIGFGPRAHHNVGCSYIDQHDVTFYLESGINVLSVIVYYTNDHLRKNPRRPGLWCQMASSKEEILKSDSSWLIHCGGSYAANRARVSCSGVFTEFFNSIDCPYHWNYNTFMPNEEWTRPDYCEAVSNEFGARLELHPLSPSVIADETYPFLQITRGEYGNPPNWTQVVFERVNGDGEEAYAAASFIFSDVEKDIPVKIFSDDPFKFFCGNRLVTWGDCCHGEEGRVLHLKPGWNRLLLVQTPSRHSMGFMIIFATEEPIRIYQDTMDRSGEEWNLVGPLKLPLKESTSSLKFESLKTWLYRPLLSGITDIHDFLRFCSFEPEETPSGRREISSGEYVLFKQSILRYGFVTIELEASHGDVVDISIGKGLDTNNFVKFRKNHRTTHTMVCRKGKNFFRTFIPSDCLYVQISGRIVHGHVKVLNVAFEELTRVTRFVTSFKTSDESLNQLWEIGKQTLRRSSAFIPLSGIQSENEAYMLDCYIDSINMVGVFGDYEYMSSRLRQFIEIQFENGDIPALTYDSRNVSQVNQLFFLPIWINYNYRMTGNKQELLSLLHPLDLTREYFEALINDETGLLSDIDHRFALENRFEKVEFGSDEAPTYLNALFCRFLLSAAEVYSSADMETKRQRCVLLAQKVAERLLQNNFDPELQLFRLRSQHPEDRQANYCFIANFCAMFGGVLPLEMFENFFYTFFNYDPPFDKTEQSKHPYFQFLFLEMMFALGQKDWAYRYFKQYWEERICGDTGAWTSITDPSLPAFTKFSNGSVVAPNVFLLREVLGLRAAEVGHAVVFFNPASKYVDWVEASIQMHKGRLKIKWEKLADGSLDITIDSTVPIKVVPELSKEELANATFRLSDGVILLSPPAEEEVQQ